MTALRVDDITICHPVEDGEFTRYTVTVRTSEADRRPEIMRRAAAALRALADNLDEWSDR